MIISLSDFIRECIKKYSTDVLTIKGDVAGLEIFINSQNKFVQINNKVYSESNPSLIVDVIPFTVADWNDEIDDDLKKFHNFITPKACKNSKISINKKDKKPLIGIFYYMPKNFSTLTGGKVEALTLDKDDKYINDGNFISSPYMHINMWENMKIKYPMYNKFSYTCIPRGRVIYSNKDKCFLIITDKCLITKIIINKIVSQFNIPKDNFKVFSEENHYECYICNPYLELQDFEIY